jgi:hypothetical protein
MSAPRPTCHLCFRRLWFAQNKATLTPAQIIERKFSYDNGWITMTEVPSTMAWASRWADAMAVGFWRGNRGAVIGFEVKTSRADWLRELKDPEKARAFTGRVDRWCVVVTDDKIVKREELPEGWGLAKVTARGFSVLVPFDAIRWNTVMGSNVDRELMAVLVRRAFEHGAGVRSAAIAAGNCVENELEMA